MSNEIQRMEDVHSPKEALRWVVQTYGVETLEAGVQVSNMLGDLLPGDEAARKRYHLALTAGVGKDVVRIYHSRNGRMDQYDAQELRNCIAAGCCFDQAFTEELVEAFLFAVTGEQIQQVKRPVKPAQTADAPARHPDIKPAVLAKKDSEPTKQTKSVPTAAQLANERIWKQLNEREAKAIQYIRDQVSSWRDIVQLIAADNGIIGLKKDGSVETVGVGVNKNAAEYSTWKNVHTIISNVCEPEMRRYPTAAPADRYLIGVRNDGVEANCSRFYPKDILKAKLTAWNAQEYAVGGNRIVGLTNGGQVRWIEKHYSENKKEYSWKEGKYFFLKWQGIRSVVRGWGWTAGLKGNGTVVIAPDKHGEWDSLCREASGWSGITALAGGYSHLLGLKADGTVVAAGENDFGQNQVQNWNGITKIWANQSNSYGLKADGTVVQAGASPLNESEWHDIAQIVFPSRSALDVDKQPECVLGLRKDGSIAMDSNAAECDYQRLKKEADQVHDAAAVSAGYGYIAILKKDGTVQLLMGRSVNLMFWELPGYDLLS